jgi:hypothetical protein
MDKQRHPISKSRIFCRRWSMKWELHGKIDYPMHYGLTEHLQDTIGHVTISVGLGKTYHLPVELEFKTHWAIRRWNMDFEVAGVKRKMQLSELDE